MAEIIMKILLMGWEFFLDIITFGKDPKKSQKQNPNDKETKC